MMTENKKEHSFKDRNLKLIITLHNKSFIEFELENLKYKEMQKKYVVFISLLSTFFAFSSATSILTYLSCICFIYWVFCILRTVQSEKVSFCANFGMQYQTKRLVNSSHMFISTGNIHDVCINEVIEHLDIHYILILRTKDGLFKETPIIPLFNNLKPPVSCLQLIWADLKSMMNNKQ